MFQPVLRFLVCSDVHYLDEPGEYTVGVRPSAPFGTRGKAIRKGFVVS